MYSFKDIKGKNVPFADKQDLEDFDLQKDFISGEITAYLVCCNECWYTVEESVYTALKNL